MPLIISEPTNPIKDLDILFRYCLRYIFVSTNKWYLHNNQRPDRESMSSQEIRLMQFSIVWWATKELPRLKAKTARKIWLFKATASQIDRDEEKYVEDKLQLMAYMLKKNDDGKFDMQKEQYYFKDIDYRKAYGLQEAYKPEDFARGAEIGRQSDIREGITKRVK